MASFFRWKRSLLFKLLLGIPALLFIIVIFLSFQSTDNNKPPSEQESVDIIKKNIKHRNSVFEGFQNPKNKINEMVQKFNPFNSDKSVKHVENNKDVIAGDNQHPVGDPNADPNERVVHEDYDASLKFRMFGPNAPGEAGAGVQVDAESLTGDERKKYDLGWQNNAFNQYVSDRISLYRTLKDVRDSDKSEWMFKREEMPAQALDTG